MPGPAERLPNLLLSAEGWLGSASLGRIGGCVARRFSLSPGDADELIQELRLAVWRADGTALLSATWIYLAAKHRALDILRARRQQLRADRRAWTPAQDGVDYELLALLRTRVSKLPPRLRRFYQLSFVMGLSEREVAHAMGLGRGAVRGLAEYCGRLLTGRLKLRTVSPGPRKRPPRADGRASS